MFKYRVQQHITRMTCLIGIYVVIKLFLALCCFQIDSVMNKTINEVRTNGTQYKIVQCNVSINGIYIIIMISEILKFRIQKKRKDVCFVKQMCILVIQAILVPYFGSGDPK